MPAPNTTSAGSLRSRARTWLEEHPGEHRPAEVSDALGITVARARRLLANELARLAREGLVQRSRPEGAAAQGPGVVYSALERSQA